MPAEPDDTAVLSPDIINTFHRKGAVCLRACFEHDWLTSLAVGIERNFSNPGPDHTVYTPENGPGGFYDDYCNWHLINEYREFVLGSPAAEIAGRLMQSNTARIYHEHVLVKEPGTREVTPWHHDLPYYGLDGNQLCSIWLPLDPVPKRYCPGFVAGSHQDTTLCYPRLFINHQNYANGVEGYRPVPDIDADLDSYSILSWELEPGDCIVFHMRTLHGAPATVGSEQRRRGFSTRWLGDDARFALRPWRTSPPFRDVDLKPGDPMDHPAFPLVWRRPT